MQSRHLDDQGVSVPTTCGPPHPESSGAGPGLRVNIPYGACKLIGNKIVITLDDLKRVWQVGRPQHSRHITLNFRIAGDPVGRVVFFDPAACSCENPTPPSMTPMEPGTDRTAPAASVSAAGTAFTGPSRIPSVSQCAVLNPVCFVKTCQTPLSLAVHSSVKFPDRSARDGP